MKKSFLLLLMAILLMGAGCQSATEIAPSDLEAAVETPTYVGNWMREHIYVDGVEEAGQVDSTLIFNQDNSFTSETEACRVEGVIEVTDNTIRMLTEESTCPEQATELTKDISYDYVISDSGNTMTNTTIYAGVEIQEVYSRIIE